MEEVCSEAQRIAKDLNYVQRKSLRRLAKGKSITGNASRDPLISRFYNHNIPRPPDGDELNVVSWCDWEAAAMSARPQITEFGAEVLKALDGEVE